MSTDRELLQVARLLLAEESAERTPEILLRRVVAAAGAEAGFLVVEEEGSFRRQFEVGAPASGSEAERRFSRTLVREVIATGRPFHVPDLAADPRFAAALSVREIGPRAVLIAPLGAVGAVWGAVYLEARRHAGGFSAAAQAFVAEMAELAGLFFRRESERQALEERNRGLERDLFARHDFSGIVTRDPRMIEVLRFIAQVASTDAPVLIQGETGTGKELAARAVHANSGRRRGPFITLHCAALPATLLEGELFGHVAGAFTDAKRDRAGRLAAAHGGTLFLDEVGEIAPEVQAKLLRFLQFGEIQRLGSDRVEKVDVRIVAATHRDLKGLSRDGRFREDLYFRLKVLDLTLPALRERRDDVLLLAAYFLDKSWRLPGERPRFTARAERALAAYPFPGNVRELAHAVERACLLARGPQVDLDLLPADIAAVLLPGEALAETETPAPELTAAGLATAREAAVAAVERRFLEALHTRYGGNVSEAARDTGIHRTYLHKLLARHRSPAGPAAETG